MSFINKICKLDKMLIVKSWSAVQKASMTKRHFSCANKSLVDEILKLKNLIDQRWLSGVNLKRMMHNQAHTYHASEILYARSVLMKNAVDDLSCLSTSLPEREDLQIVNVQDILNNQWKDMNIENILSNFEILSYFSKKEKESLCDPKYEDVLKEITNRLPRFSDENLIFLLKCLEFWEFDVKNEIFKQLYEAIDRECMNRRKAWSIDKIFYFQDLFFKLKLNRIVNFTWFTLDKLGYKPTVMSTKNLVKFVFFLKANRRIRSTLYNVEYCFEQNFEHFTIEELGIFAMAFIKYKTSIKNKCFAAKICQKLVNEIDTVDDFTTTALLKILTSFTKSEHLEIVNKLIDALEAQVEKKSLNYAVNAAVWMKEQRVEKKEMLMKTLNKCEIELSQMTMSQMRKVLYSLFTFNYNQNVTKFFSLVFEEVFKPERVDQIDRFPKHLISMTLSSINSGFYNKKALEQIMDPEFKKPFLTKHHNLLEDYLAIHHNVEIEYSEYDGPKLKDDEVQLLLKKCGCLNNYKRRYNRRIVDKFYNMQNIISTCQKLCGSESAVLEDILLPHLCAPNLVLCYDPETKQYVSPNELSEIPLGNIKYALKDGKEWYALVLATELLYMKNTGNPTGLLNMKLRLLKRMGYKPVVIRLKDWNDVTEDDQRLEYMRKFLP